MISTVLKYNTYKEIISHKRSGLGSNMHRSAVHESNEATISLLIRTSILLIIMLVSIYIVEKSSMVFSQRIVSSQERKAIDAEKEVSNLEITTTQLSATHNLSEIVSEENMITPHEVSYLNIEAGTVAFAK